MSAATQCGTTRPATRGGPGLASGQIGSVNERCFCSNGRPGLARPYRLRRPGLVAPLAFTVANVLLLWTGWHTVAKLLAVVGLGLVGLAGLAAAAARLPPYPPRVDAAVWIVPYLVGMGLMSDLGPFGHGARSPTSQWVCLGICVAFSVAIYFLAVTLGIRACRLMPEGGRPLDRWEQSRARDAGDPVNQDRHPG